MSKKMDFFDASREVAGTERGIKRYGGDYFIVLKDGRLLWKKSKTLKDYPAPEQQKEKEWEVEPEELFVWGVQNSHKEGVLYTKAPKKDCGNYWFGTKRFSQGIFSEGKPKKFKLVPVEEE